MLYQLMRRDQVLYDIPKENLLSELLDLSSSQTKDGFKVVAWSNGKDYQVCLDSFSVKLLEIL